MNRTADVRSMDALRTFRHELKRYLEAMRMILDSLKIESNKAMSWIEDDRTRYWPRARKRADDRLVEARNALLHCKMAAVEGQRKSCQDEKNAVELAVARLRHCESQVNVVKRWRHRMRHETEEFVGKLSRLSNYVENDLPKAIAALDRMIVSLEKYAQSQTPRPNEVRLRNANPPNSSNDSPSSNQGRG